MKGIKTIKICELFMFGMIFLCACANYGTKSVDDAASRTTEVIGEAEPDETDTESEDLDADGVKNAYYLELSQETTEENHYDYAGDEIGLSDKQKAQLVSPNQATDMTRDDMHEIQVNSDFEGNMEDVNLYYIKSIGTPGADDYFQIYLTEAATAVIITPDGKAVAMNGMPVDFIYETLPELQLADYDGDGVDELSIWTYIFHGTGFRQETLYMLDKSEYDYWTVYHLTPDFYVGELRKHYMAIDREDAILVSLDGVAVNELDKEGDTSLYRGFGDALVRIECGNVSKGEKAFVVHTIPIFYSEQNVMGLAGNTMDMTVSYLGSGKWSVDSIDVGVNEYE